MTWRFWALILPVWFALSVICGFAFGLMGWLGRRVRRWRAQREYRKFSDQLDTMCDRNRALLDNIARYPRRKVQ